jgi:hypothetical protein
MQDTNQKEQSFGGEYERTGGRDARTFADDAKEKLDVSDGQHPAHVPWCGATTNTAATNTAIHHIITSARHSCTALLVVL